MDDRIVIRQRVAAVCRLGLDQVDENAGAFDMPQKLVTQADPGMSPFDETRDICQEEVAVEVQLDAAEIGKFCGERIIGDFRPRPGKSTEQRALAGIGFADQSDVGDRFEFQNQVAAFARSALCRFSRCAIGRRFEVGVSPSRHAPLVRWSPDRQLARDP